MKRKILIFLLMLVLSLAAGCANSTADPPPEASLNRPSPFAALSVTAQPGASKSYYTVEKNGRRGVVNELGQIVLPFEYSKIDILYYGGMPAVFFAIPAQVKTNGQKSSVNWLSYDGLLFNLDGRLIYKDKCRYANPISDSLIEVYGDESCGVISYEGEEIIPVRYNSISLCKDNIVAAAGGSYDNGPKGVNVDIYDKNGVLRNRGKINLSFTDNIYLIVADDSGTKFGFMDLDFKEIVPAKWDALEFAGSGHHIVRRGEKYGVIDSRGNEIIPVKYNYSQFYSDPADPDSVFFSAAAEDGAYVFDDSGKKIFYSDKYTSATIHNGAVIAQDKSLTYHYLNLKGEEIIPPAQRMFADNSGLISCYNAGVCTYYTKDGDQLLLPDSDSISTVSPERFIFLLKDKWLYGLCDARGNIIIPAKYTYLYPSYEKSGLIVFNMAEKYGKVNNGVIDVNDGSVLLDGFASLQYAGGGLFYAQKGAVYGLIDINGNWIWQASDYQTLMD